MSTDDQLPPGKPLLAIAHPGHELRVHHWLEIAAPDVLVLTDGSAHGGIPQLAATHELLDRLGAHPAGVFGALADWRLYDSILSGNVALLADLTRQIASQIVSGRYDYVLGDPAENVNPGHDVFRAMLDAAVELARRRTERTILNLDYPLEAASDSVHPLLRSRTYVLELDEEALDRKIAAARCFITPGGDFDAVLRKLSVGGLGVECLRPAVTEAGLADVEGTPAYEIHGEQIALVVGYERAVRHATHVRPLLERLHAMLGLAETQISCAA